MEAFLGFGKLAEQILCHFNIKKGFSIFDDFTQSSGKSFKFDEYLRRSKDFEWILALGYSSLEKKHSVLFKLLDSGASLKSLVHPTSHLNKSSKIYPGSIVYPMCNIDGGVEISSGTILNNSVIISHDCKIGECTYFSPGVIVSGDVVIGKRCFLGAGSIITNGVSIGDDVTVGIGSVITNDIPTGSQVIGNPLKFLDKKIKLK